MNSLQDAQKRIQELNDQINELKQQKKQEQEQKQKQDKEDEKQKESKLIMGLPSTMDDNYQLNLRKIMERAAIVQPNVEIVTKIQGGYHRMNYVEVQQRATKLASALSKAGVQIGDRIATFMWNNGRHLLLYYAIPSMGAVLHTLNLRLHPKELNYIIDHAQDKIIFVDSNLLPLFEQIPVNTLKQVQHIVICGPNETTGNWKSQLTNTIDFDDFIKTGNNDYDWPNLHESSAMSLCYTSGTTGNPKGVLYSHRSTFLHTLTAATKDFWEISGADCVMPIVPMFHALCWSIPFQALMLGCKLLLYNCYRQPEDFISFCIEEQCTAIAGVPTIMQGIQGEMIKNPNKWNKFQQTVKRAVCGGSAPSPSLIKWYWEALGIEIIHAWGMTETNPLGSYGRRIMRRKDLNYNDDQKFENQLTQGVMAPCVEAKIVNPDNLNQELIHDGKNIGELLVHGPWVTTHYYRENYQDKFYKNWLITGDIATLNKNEELIIKDRSKDLIKSGGEWISSQDLENCIMGMKNVLRAAVLGVKHPKWEERPIVVVELTKKDEKMTLEDIRQYCMKQQYAKFQLPDDVLFREVPLTGTGKISKKDLREQLKKENYVHPDINNNQ